MLFKLFIIILTLELFCCQPMQNTVNQVNGNYRGNTFFNSQSFRTDNTVNQVNGLYFGSTINGKKRSINSNEKLQTELRNGTMTVENEGIISTVPKSKLKHLHNPPFQHSHKQQRPIDEATNSHQQRPFDEIRPNVEMEKIYTGQTFDGR